MIKRCIMIFPEFENGEVIDRIRNKYDPLANHVRPHITLVFPFDSDIETSQLKTHMQDVLSGIKPFTMILKGVTSAKSNENYLFLNIKEGKDIIIDMHEKLYTGILQKYYPKWLKKGYFLPHMTVGKIKDGNELIAAVNETRDVSDIFQTIVNKISVENIDENEDSILELNILLE